MDHHPLSPALMTATFFAGCKPEVIQLPAKPRPISLPAGSAHSTSSAINIPSPPLTPRHSHFDDAQQDGGTQGGLSVARLQQQRRCSPERLQRHSSAPRDESPLSMRLSTSAPTRVTAGFTFSSNLETETVEEHDTYRNFLHAMEADYWKSVSTIRTTYFFDGIGRGGGFLAIPHIASHGNAKTNALCRLLEAWLTKKLVEPTISDSIPVLEDDIQTSIKSIEKHLRQDPKVWAGISKSCIHIRCGHVFMLDTCCDDETIVHLGADEFYVDYPLFVDVEIKMHCDQSQDPKSPQPAEVLIAFENVVNRSNSKEPSSPYLHRIVISDFILRQKSLASPK
ncbi:hypothetical protein DFQ27_007756 [Actinomortierella ambigua]|uniref:Uncharacterized protein n=1 Tax=Actinomortierella ambigua TaxID=1343610 RepID=A0A9P6QIL4_9FUNG|nr:hypothetical protein DFQ27_007756 [Actinomortierella ambigua]